MPLPVDENLPTSFPKPDYLTFQNFKRGVITLINESRLPKNALKELKNLFLAEDGQPSYRPGIDWFGVSPLTTTATTVNAPTAASGTNWTNPTNVFSSNDSRAVFATTTQNDLKITGFGFTIPTNATILGVTVTVEGNGTDATAANRSVELGLTKDGTTLSGTRAASQQLNQTTDTTLTFGSSSSMFSTTLTAAEINATTFGVLLRAANTNAGARNIDAVTVSVAYTYNYPIDGFDYFDFGGVVHLVCVSGGRVHRSIDDGATWTQCTAATLTVGTWTNMNQNGNFLYLTNGVDNIVRYDGSTTLQVYTALTTPAAPTAVTTPAGPFTVYTYYYKISAVNAVGFSAASTKVTVTHDTPRSAWDKTTNYATLTFPAYQATQTRYDIYFSEDDLTYYYLDSQSTPNLSYKDDGSAVVVPSTLAPTGNTTQGPKVEELTNVGVRQYGVRDHDNRYRISFTGAGNFAGSFSSAYDGGYLDWQPGGKLIPVKVADYRSGKGDNIATIWCDSADGLGGVIQMSLSTLTVGTISITVPSAYVLPGSRGTPAPDSVVNVLNDYYFYNSQALYNLGTRQQTLNILSTDEVSANVRPNVKRIDRTGEPDIASTYFDANIYISVPIGDTINNTTMIYNTEMKAWIPEAFTVGFRKFLRYTDQNRSQHLLALKPGDNRLSEISTAFQGDYGVSYETSLTTGLYKTTNDVFEFQFVEEAEFELAQAQGTVYVELLGIDRPTGFRSIKTVQLSNTSKTTNVGWDTFGWDVMNWDDTSSVPDVVSESSIKRYFTIQVELNAVQWHIYTSGIDSRYTHRTFQTWGTSTQGGHPAPWRLTGI